MASERKQSSIGRVVRFMAFGLLPLLFLIGAAGAGYRVVVSALRYNDEQTQLSQRQGQYQQIATGIAAEATPESPVSWGGAGKGDTALNVLRDFRLQDFITNTPAPTIAIPAVNTPVPEASATATPEPATSTPVPTETPSITNTPRPLPTLLMPGNVEPQVAAPTAIPTQVPFVDRQGQDIVNILLLGNDGEITNDGYIRTDTMIILSVNRSAGTVGMLSLPRDLYVYMPGWTMQRINVAYIHGESAGWTDGGFGLLRETIFYNLGINVHFYAMVDLTGFKEMVDTVGGIDVGVECALQDYPLIGAELPTGVIQANDENLWTLPVGYYHLEGSAALWYARSRGNSTDFDRGRRQQQVLRAIWRKARDSGQLAQIPDLWTQGLEIVETNMTFDDMLTLMPIALSLDSDRMEQFNLRRLYDTTPWQTPDGDYVQLPNYDHIRELLVDLYQPPTQSQVNVEAARIVVRNGTTNADWDRVGAEYMNWEGFNAVAGGTADNTAYTDTVIIDYTGQSKGSSLQTIAAALNVLPQNVRVEPDSNREYDFEVILGTNNTYRSCANVLPPV